MIYELSPVEKQLPLHIPDGFLNIPIALFCWVIAIIVIGIAVKRTQKDLNERLVPLMGVMAAFVFAAQMINFPVAGGTSGHFLGGALTAIALGPWAGMLVMTAVVGVQALLFQDGGLIVMGANILNMGLLTAIIGYGLYRAAAGRSKRMRLGAAALGAWLSVIASALLTSIQLWLSGTSPLRVVLPSMLGVHVLIGIGEALITVAAVAYIARIRPNIMSEEAVKGRGAAGWAWSGAFISLLVLAFSPWASTNPDGLERVAEDLGFLSLSVNAPYQTLPDYTIPFLGESGLSTVLAGFIGIVVVAAIAVLVSLILKRSRSNNG